MTTEPKQNQLQNIPSISDLLQTDTAVEWMNQHPRSLITDCLRQAVESLRNQILDDNDPATEPDLSIEHMILLRAGDILHLRTRTNLRHAINATGIILHTNLGRAVWPESVTDSLAVDLKGYVTLELDRETGKRDDRNLRVEQLLTELTGAESAIVVNNNAAATMLALAALCRNMDVIVSRGQLIEIGGSFRLPEVMAESGAFMVEVGSTNRTHPKDYTNAITDEAAALFRAHPSNYKIVGFTCETSLDEMVRIAHDHDLMMIDDLGSGALIDLEQFGLPHEQTVGESIQAGSDIVLFSADKLIGAGQGGIIVGRKDLVDRIRKHPLARAVRADKVSLMILERTLPLFRDPDRLRTEHPLYRMLSKSPETLQQQAEQLADLLNKAHTDISAKAVPGSGYLGSGSLPTQSLPTYLVQLTITNTTAATLAPKLRLDEACIFTRVENDAILFDVRTLMDGQIETIEEAVAQVCNL